MLNGPARPYIQLSMMLWKPWFKCIYGCFKTKKRTSKGAGKQQILVANDNVVHRVSVVNLDGVNECFQNLECTGRLLKESCWWLLHGRGYLITCAELEHHFRYMDCIYNCMCSSEIWPEEHLCWIYLLTK